jgi:hypothetical protein
MVGLTSRATNSLTLSSIRSERILLANLKDNRKSQRFSERDPEDLLESLGVDGDNITTHIE